MSAYKYTLRQNFYFLLSPFLSLLQPFFAKPKRPWGISVMIRLFNEEYTIAESLLSLNDFADEVVIINNGCTDKSIEKIEEIRTQLKYELKIFENVSKNHVEISNYALSKTSFQWIVRWDGDFIAHTSGKQNISRLRSFLLSLPKQRYYLIYPTTVTFAGDAFHVEKGKEYHSEHYIHSFHPHSKYVRKGKFEVLQAPFFYKIIRLKKIFFVHLGTVKPLKRILYRFHWGEWWRNEYYQTYPDYEDFLNSVVLKKSNMDKWQLAKKELQEIIQRSRKYKTEEFGNYPELMQKFIENPLFKVLEKDGKPYSRSDF